jgi:hypothetical protein
MKLRKDKRAQRQREATLRNEKWQKLSVTEKIAYLDENNLIADRQRTILNLAL